MTILLLMGLAILLGLAGLGLVLYQLRKESHATTTAPSVAEAKPPGTEDSR